VAQPAEQFQVLPPVQVLVECRVLPEQPDPAAHGAGFAHDVVPGDLGPSRVGPQQGGEDAHERRLARPVGAEHGVHGAAPDGQVEPVQRGPGAGLPAVGPPHGVHGDRMIGHGVPPPLSRLPERPPETSSQT
jgi:hypothetical protein